MPVEAEVPEVEDAALTSFETFYRRNYRSVLGLAFVLSGSQQLAEEVAQEAFIRALSRWDGQLRHPEAWVRQVAVNLSRSRLRRAAAELRALGRLGARRPAAVTVVDELPVEVSAYWAAVRRLPVRQGQAVALHYLDDLSVRDVAVVMGCAPGTVKALLHQARRRLAGLLGPEEVDL